MFRLFESMASGCGANTSQSNSFETVFIKIHGNLFMSSISNASEHSERFHAAFAGMREENLLNRHIAEAGSRFKGTGIHAAVSNLAALFEFGQNFPLRLAYDNARQVTDRAIERSPNQFVDRPAVQQVDVSLRPDLGAQIGLSTGLTFDVFDHATKLAFLTLGVCLRRPEDRNVYPLIHIYLIFLWSLSALQKLCPDLSQEIAWETIEKEVPWPSICDFLNVLAISHSVTADRVLSGTFPQPPARDRRPLPEDFILQGQLYSQWHLPRGWFPTSTEELDADIVEHPSMTFLRIERMLWLGHRIASVCLASKLKHQTLIR